MDLFEYFEELNRQNDLNKVFTNNIIVENKFKDYISNLHKSNECVNKKKQIINRLIPKIKKYNARMSNFKRINLMY